MDGGSKQKENMQDLVAGIEDCALQLSKWNKTEFGNLNVQIKVKQKELDRLMATSVIEAERSNFMSRSEERRVGKEC